MKELYEFVGNSEFYEFSNIIWVLLGVFLIVYATSKSGYPLFKIVFFVYGILYGSFLGGIIVKRTIYIWIGIILFWIVSEICMQYRKKLILELGIFILLSRFFLRFALFAKHTMEVKGIFIILSMVTALLVVIVFGKNTVLNMTKRWNNSIKEKVFLLISVDLVASGLCEIIGKQSEGAWKFFFDDKGIFEYYIYMSKIEIREIHIFLIYMFFLFFFYFIGIKVLGRRLTVDSLE